MIALSREQLGTLKIKRVVGRYQKGLLLYLYALGTDNQVYFYKP